nr:hypothetical protein [Tanacetum cinerariifolium]
MINIPNNNNGWIKEDDEEDMEAEEDDEEDIIMDEISSFDSDDETESVDAVVPVTSSTLRPLPPIRQFSGCNMKTLHYKVKTLDRQMFDRYNNEFRMVKKFDQNDKRMNGFDYELLALEATAREQGSDHLEMRQLVKGLSREQLPEDMRFREVHHGPPTGSTPMPHSDDPYAIVKDAATSTARDNGDDPAVPNDPSRHSHMDHHVIINGLVSLVVPFVM